jgi:hypothetical protein
MDTSPMFASAPARKGMYESFYLRAVSPHEPVSVWIRHTVDKPPGERARGSVWCTVFDAARGRPFMHKLSSDALSAPSGGWIEVGHPHNRAHGATVESSHGAADERSQSATQQGSAGLTREDAQGATMSAEAASGSCGAAAWSLRFSASEPPLRHLPREWLYSAPLPRTKLTSPAPATRIDGSLRLGAERELALDGWRGMIGHNWGAEHAERWIWLHGVGFEQEPDAWLDVALGRVKIAGRMTPWVANGALSLGGERLRVGGLGARGLRVAESAEGCELHLPGERGLTIGVRAEIPAGTAAGWRYGDPHGGAGHDVVNCSIAALTLVVTLPGERSERALTSAHGGVYELGMRERDHGVPIAPFAD